MLSVFPTGLACVAPNLTELNISNNPLEELNVRHLPPLLKTLTASNCKIWKVHDESQPTGTCRLMDGLECQHHLHTNLQYLETIDLSSNQLTNAQLLCNETPFEPFSSKIFPPLDLLYPSLEGLNLTGNNLSGEFNPNIGHQMRLKWIRLDGNQLLERIPMEMAHLRKSNQLVELSMA